MGKTGRWPWLGIQSEGIDKVYKGVRNQIVGGEVALDRAARGSPLLPFQFPVHEPRGGVHTIQFTNCSRRWMETAGAFGSRPNNVLRGPIWSPNSNRALRGAHPPLASNKNFGRRECEMQSGGGVGQLTEHRRGDPGKLTRCKYLTRQIVQFCLPSLILFRSCLLDRSQYAHHMLDGMPTFMLHNRQQFSKSFICFMKK